MASVIDSQVDESPSNFCKVPPSSKGNIRRLDASAQQWHQERLLVLSDGPNFLLNDANFLFL